MQLTKAETFPYIFLDQKSLHKKVDNWDEPGPFRLVTQLPKEKLKPPIMWKNIFQGTSKVVLRIVGGR